MATFVVGGEFVQPSTQFGGSTGVQSTNYQTPPDGWQPQIQSTNYPVTPDVDWINMTPDQKAQFAQAYAGYTAPAPPVSQPIDLSQVWNYSSTPQAYTPPAYSVTAPQAAYVAPPAYTQQGSSEQGSAMPSQFGGSTSGGGNYTDYLNQASSGFQPFLQPTYDEQGLSPYMKAAIQNYEMNIMPAIQNSYASIGLGSSPAMSEGVAAGYYSILPQVLQLQQQGQLEASQGLGQLAGYENQRYGIDQNTALGYAGLDTQRYGIDQQAAAAAAARELQAQQIALQGELGYGQLGLGAAANELQQRSLSLQAMGLAGQLENQQYQAQLDAYYNEMLRLQQLAILGITGLNIPIGSQVTG